MGLGRLSKQRSKARTVLTAIAVAASCAAAVGPVASAQSQPTEQLALLYLPPAGPFAHDRGTSPSQLANRVMIGAFTYGGVWRGMQPVLDLEEALGRRLDIVHWFTNWDQPYFPEMVAAVAAAGRKPLISWQPHRQSVADIAAGHHDRYLRLWARGVRGSGGEVYLRPFPEMNGDWVPWNGEPETLKLAWRRMAAIFAEEGAGNVRWVFSPNVTDSPKTEANRMENYYPGDDVVDVLALDGYNWGTTREWTAWRSFEEVFNTGYERIITLGSQPVWFDENKEADWRMVADPEVATIFRQALANSSPLALR